MPVQFPCRNEHAFYLYTPRVTVPAQFRAITNRNGVLQRWCPLNIRTSSRMWPRYISSTLGKP